jgi:hypothetical protein
MKKAILAAAIIFCSFTLLSAGDLGIETIGVLGGQNLYYSYMTLGLAAEQLDKGSYTPDLVSGIAKDVAQSCKKSRNYFQKLIDKNILTGEDAQLGRQIMDAYDSVSSFANSLLSVIETRNSETLKAFEKYRTSSWGKIQTILKLED